MMHIFSTKKKTKPLSIRPIADAQIYHIPLGQSTDIAAEPCVAVGDSVVCHQQIGRSTDYLCANVHAPVSGTITAIGNHPLADGTLVPTITIANDFENRTASASQPDTGNLSAGELLNIIADMGIVGEGGAQFPTAVKYDVGGQEIDTFIVNGTECEPYLTADYALMSQHTEQLLQGILFANKILRASRIVITIEEQNKELEKVFAPYLGDGRYSNVSIKILPDHYPQGGELQVIKSVTGIELPRDKRPATAGVIVSNVGTVCAIYHAVADRLPLTSRILTLSGECGGKEGNYEVKIGTPIGHILSSLGLSDKHKTLVLGGPMMGKQIAHLSAPITKGSSGVLFFEQSVVSRGNCISCGYCAEVCPMYLMPMKFEEIYRKKKYGNLSKYGIASCIECAACEYVCPANVALIESIKEGKLKLKQMADALSTI